MRAARPENLPGMARFGIDTSNALGLSVPYIIHSVLSDQTASDILLANGEVAHGVKRPVVHKG
jgi:hypothetical protein